MKRNSIIDPLSNLKIDIDKISFDFSAINTFNFKINTFRGINIGNHFNLGQFISNRNLYGKNPILKNSNNIWLNKDNFDENDKNFNNKNT